jgi:hypothetical protein
MRNLRTAFFLVLAGCILLFGSERLHAVPLILSDYLQIDYGGITTTVYMPENTDGSEPMGDVGPFNPFLPNPGYVTLLDSDIDSEGNQTFTVSDILVSYTGSSLQYFSDGSPGFPPDLSNLTELARLVETGGPQPVGQYFGVGPNQIVIMSDVPEPSTILLFSMGVLGLLGYAWRRRQARSAQ